MIYKVGIAGLGAIGKTVANALVNDEIPDMQLHCVAELHDTNLDVPNVSFAELAERCDIVIEALPPEAVRDLAEHVLKAGKILIMITGSAVLRFPEIKDWANENEGRLIIPSGALSGLDGVQALHNMGMKSAKIQSTKPPLAYDGAPFIINNAINLAEITDKTMIFSGNALEAAQAFPANVNVSSTLSLAGLGPDKTTVEVWADPDAKGNCHEISVIGEYTTITAKIENTPDPANPKTSMLAAYSIIRCLKQMTEKITVR